MEALLAITVPADSRVRLRNKLEASGVFGLRGGGWDDGSTSWAQFVSVPPGTTPTDMGAWLRSNVRRDEFSVCIARIESEDD